MRYILIYYVPIIFMLSCESEVKLFNDHLTSNFANKIILDGEQINTQDHETYDTVSMKYIDSLLVLNTNTDGKLISIYDTEGNFVSEFGRFGNGPNEFNDYFVLYYTINDMYHKGTFVTVFDNNLLTLSKINLNESIETKNIVIEEIYEFPRELKRLSRVFYIDSSKIIGIHEGQLYKRLDQKTGIVSYNSIDQSFYKKELVNIDFRSNSGDEFTHAYLVTLLNHRLSAVTPSKKYLVTAMKYLPIVEIFSLDSLTKIQSYSINNTTIEPDFDQDNFEKRMYPEYYSEITVTDENIYLLNNSALALPDEKKKTLIQVINFQGEITTEYVISDKYDINSFTVNEADSIFYGLSYSQDAIYKFDYSSRQ